MLLLKEELQFMQKKNSSVTSGTGLGPANPFSRGGTYGSAHSDSWWPTAWAQLLKIHDQNLVAILNLLLQRRPVDHKLSQKNAGRIRGIQRSSSYNTQCSDPIQATLPPLAWEVLNTSWGLLRKPLFQLHMYKSKGRGSKGCSCLHRCFESFQGCF